MPVWTPLGLAHFRVLERHSAHHNTNRALQRKYELQRRKNARYGAGMSAQSDEDLQRRARAIWAYSNRKQDELAELARVDSGRMTAWMKRTRAAKPTVPELIRLARVAGVPRRFAEQGFAGQWQPDEALIQDVADLKREARQLRDALEKERLAVAERVLEVEQRLDAMRPPDDRAQDRRQQ